MMFFVNAVIIFITLMNIVVYYLRQREEKNYDRERKNSSSVLLDHYSCRRFSLREIKSATRNFDEALVIGKGGFGKVYKGIIDDGASTVAIKRLDFGSKQGAPQFRAEIEMLSKFRHGHLVTLIGYCNQHDEMIIVYQYMAGGSLESRLHKLHRLGGDNNSSLSWVQRLKVCIGAARGLNYLHTGTSIQDRVIHRDVKSSNILLDENMEAKISDFGLSKIGPANQTCTHVSTHVRGTRGYLDPDYILTRRVTRKSDVYAFGVVLLETLCGRPAVNLRLDEEQWGLAFWAKQCIKEGRLLDIVDSDISGSIVSKCLKVFAEIAEQCLHNSSKRRPTMAEVVTRLEYALALQEGNASYGVEADVISDTHGYGDQDGADLSTVTEASNGVGGMSTEGEVINADNEQIVESRQLGDSSHSQTNIKPLKKRSIMKKVRLFFSTKPQVFSAEDLHLGQLKRYSFRELQVATRNFSDTSYLGGGSFGNVYKGCLVDGSLVAVRRLQKELTQSTELQFQAEVEKLGMAMHRNVLQLRGFCMTPTERLLVYPYMANNNVASYLRERTEWRSPLSWQTRKQIAIGSARGLAYLHDDCVPMIIHRNVKAANMLLDEEFEVVIGHFGFAKFMDNDDTHVTTDVMGTYGYIAPEYYSTGKCSQKADVYGYGVMLLELITGQKATDTDIMLVVWHLEEKDYGERTISSTALLPDNGCRRFSLTEIQFATQNFNEAFVIGNGGFGKVYKGIIDSGASTVAIKRLDIGSSQGAPEFWTEIEMLSKFRHSHLLSLIGYCNDQNEMIIVYEYMPSGSLEDNLYKIGRSNGQNRRSLPWIQRLKICLGAARGLDYLHTGTSTEHRVIHRDVKSSNILLDENMEAKISDFGLSKIGPINQPCTDVCTHVKGTFGYLDPQYFLTHRLTKKSDVYAFGVVLFEVLCGRPAVDSRLDEEQWGLAGWAKQCVKEGKISQFVDPSLNGSILSNCLDEFSIIACQCLHNSSKRRPTMGEVVTKLEFALAMQEMPDTSLLEDEIIRPFGTYDNKEITNASTEQGISNPAPGRGTSTEQEVVNARNTGSNFGQFDSFWRLGGPSLAYSYARPAKKRTFVKRLRAFFSLKYPSTTEMPDTSLLEDEINRPLGTFENQEIADSTTDQWISNTAPGRDTFTEQEVVNVPNTGSNFGEIDSFWRQGGLSLVMSHARNDRKRTKRVRAFFSSKFRSTTETESLDGLESFKFDFGTVRTATDNFAHANKLGEGGFGPVFKGRLQNGQEVAIKMLSITSSQGESEFRNEVMLLRKVHHKNLIRLLGFCVKGNQKLLIYEFAQNGSLDRFLFGAVNYPYLNWDHRYKIIRGVARGIHYLHEESPFRIFHRNIKPSNILLGAEFDPKISDFGFANLLNQRVSECSTDKIVGTCGYLAPEYVVNGKFSVKTDVFSFGILLLEVIRGQKMMTYSFVGDNSDNNIENAWRNWREGTPLNFADLTLRADLNDGADVVKCIQIGLLCIQDKAVERPTMGSVLLMLSSSSTSLPEPSEPAFSIRCSNNIYQEESISDGETDMWNHYSGSEDSMTDLYPR